MFDDRVRRPVGYTIRITRDPEITLSEWRELVSERKDVRLQHEPATARNPRTEEMISVGVVAGDVEALLDGQWAPCFRWRIGDPAESVPSAIVFEAPGDFEDPGCRIRGIARELARSLGAKLAGEEDEEYE